MTGDAGPRTWTARSETLRDLGSSRSVERVGDVKASTCRAASHSATSVLVGNSTPTMSADARCTPSIGTRRPRKGHRQ